MTEQIEPSRGRSRAGSTMSISRPHRPALALCPGDLIIAAGRNTPCVCRATADFQYCENHDLPPFSSAGQETESTDPEKLDNIG